MQEYPLVSLILLSYESGNYIYTAIDSYLQQDYPNLEIIISDDGSKDFDAGKIKRYIDENKKDNVKSVSVIQHKKNMGTVKNENRAIEVAKGNYIKTLGADDALYSRTVVTQLVEFAEAKKTDLLFGRVMKCDFDLNETGEFLKDDFLRESKEWESEMKYKKMCHKNMIPAPGCFFSRNFFDINGLFDETYRVLEDWPTWLRILREGQKIYYAQDIVAVKYRCNAGVSTDVNLDFLRDKTTCFNNEIKPFKTRIGWKDYFVAWATLKVYNSIFLRKIYVFFTRKK